MNKVALVTGSSKGIGKAIATKLGQEGYETYVTYFTDKSGGEDTINTIVSAGGKAYLAHLDVMDEESVRSLIDTIKERSGHIDMLVNNAGIERAKGLEDISFTDWNAVIQTKINGCFLCTKCALPLMKDRTNANIVIITSSMDHKLDSTSPAYCIANAGVTAFAKMMAEDLKKYGIRVNAVAPGQTRTALWNNVPGGDDEQMWQEFEKRGTMTNPEQIADTVFSIINNPDQNGDVIYFNQ